MKLTKKEEQKYALFPTEACKNFSTDFNGPRVKVLISAAEKQKLNGQEC